MSKIPSHIPWKNTGKSLGQGGQGSVYEVFHKDEPDGARYAMKVLKNTSSQQAKDRFIREIEALKAVSHPGIVPVVAHSNPDESFSYLVMKLIADAKPLEKIIYSPQNPFYGNSLLALELFEQLCEALSECHNQGIIHRDLKPANILMTPDQRIHLIDFGLCQIEDDEAITLIDEGVGTPNFMAPECESGNEIVIGPASDLYSAAKVVWSAITGKKAFAREKPAFKSASLLKIFPDSVSLWHLQAIFAKSIRHDPENRFKDAAEAKQLSTKTRYLIEAGYPPIEFIHNQCSMCGVGKLKSFNEDYIIFANPCPRGYKQQKCDYCGFCMVFDESLFLKNLEERINLS